VFTPALRVLFLRDFLRVAFLRVVFFALVDLRAEDFLREDFLRAVFLRVAFLRGAFFALVDLRAEVFLRAAFFAPAFFALRFTAICKAMILSLTACAGKRDPASIAGWCCHGYSIKQEFTQLFALAKTLVRPQIPAAAGRAGAPCRRPRAASTPT